MRIMTSLADVSSESIARYLPQKIFALISATTHMAKSLRVFPVEKMKKLCSAFKKNNSH